MRSFFENRILYEKVISIKIIIIAKKIRRRSFSSSTKREIRQFHAVLMQCGQRNERTKNMTGQKIISAEF